MRPCLLFLLLTGVAAADDPKEKAVRDDRDKLVGTWTVTDVEANGQSAPAEAIKDFEFIFTADTLTRKKGGKAQSGSGFKLDPSKSPKWIDMTGTTDGKDVSIPAVYKLDGDTLTLCFRNDYKKKNGKPNEFQKRPEKLDGGAGTQQVLMTLKRQKP